MTNPRKIKVLVADDSKVARMLLVHLLESDPCLHVLGAVENGQEALNFVKETGADIVVMDIHMPVMDGFEATRLIMESTPVPIVICTATGNPQEVATTFRLMEAGAVACVEKPVSRDHANFEELATALLETVRLMSEVKVIRRWPKPNASQPAAPRPVMTEFNSDAIQVIGIGASTGGPPVLETILSGLPKDFPVPILMVQHIARGFLPGLIEWLNQTTGWQVHSGAHGMRPLPGHAYLAPDDFQMGMSEAGLIKLTRGEAEYGVRPAVSHLFRSLQACCGANAIGVLLTGMGKDGAMELKGMKESGAVTIAQDRDTSVVHGMPGEAIKLNGASHVLPSCKIADALISIVKRRNQTGGNGR